jgi:hypothetical protein
MKRLLAAGSLAIMAALPISAFADSGMAYDSVNRLVVNADPATMQPGSFDQDYATASQSAPAPSGGGLFGKFKQAIAMGENAGAMIRNGMATRHYVAGSKSRIDMNAMGMAFITDCAARTITVLNLHDKTYRVESMDHPSVATGNATGTSSAPAKDDGTKVAIAVQNRALGASVVGGEHTNGYRSTMSFTETKPGAQPQTQHLDMVAYYSGIRAPMPSCSRFGATGGMSPGDGMAMMAAASRVMQSLAAAGIDKRFSLSQSGPPLPAGNLAMYEALFFGDKGTAFVSEVGNVRPIGANDPIFSIPPDFTKQ